MKFLERYLSNPKCMDLFDARYTFDRLGIIIDFLANSKSLEGISDLINLLTNLSSQPSNIVNTNGLQSICELARNKLIQTEAFNYLLPKVIAILQSPDSKQGMQYLAMCTLEPFAIDNFLTRDVVQEFIETVIALMKNRGAAMGAALTEAAAISLVGRLSGKELIDKALVEEFIKAIIDKLYHANNDKVISAVLQSLVVVSTKFLDFKTADGMIPRIAQFLNHETQRNKENACSFIQLHAEKGLDQTKHADILIENFISILSRERADDVRHSNIFDLCNKLLKTNLVDKSVDTITKLKAIAMTNLKNPIEIMRVHAAELFSLVTPQEEQSAIITKLVFESIFERYVQSPHGAESVNLVLTDLIEFFKNIDLNTQELTAQTILLINSIIVKNGSMQK